MFTKETSDESTQTLEAAELESLLKNNEDVINMPGIFLRCNKRESSPFVGILPSVSGRSSASSCLFPNLISHALKSGAGAGTKFMI